MSEESCARSTLVSPPYRNSRPDGVNVSGIRALSGAEAFVLSRVDGRRSIEAIAAHVRLTPRETLQVLRSLVANGHLRTLGPSASMAEMAEMAEMTEMAEEAAELEDLDVVRESVDVAIVDDQVARMSEEPFEIEHAPVESDSDRPTAPALDDPFARATRPVLWVSADAGRREER